MSPALLILTGAFATLSAVIALIFGAPIGIVAGAYLVTGLLLSVGIVVAGWLNVRGSARDQRYANEVEAEMITLRESAAGDARFGSGSPEALSPVLHRTLIAREGAIEREHRHDSELLIRVRR